MSTIVGARNKLFRAIAYQKIDKRFKGHCSIVLDKLIVDVNHVLLLLSVHNVIICMLGLTYRIYDTKTSQSRNKFRQDQRVGLVPVKVPECAFELLQLRGCQIGHVPRYNLLHVSMLHNMKNKGKEYVPDCQ